MKVVVSYDGSHYKGWQCQSHKNSVQQVIEGALQRMHKEPVSIFASGRTDAGVHALGQVFHFDTHLHITKEKWLQALNSYTPKDIYFIDIEEVDDEFHSRYSAKRKIYEYRFNPGAYNVHRLAYCWQLRHCVDIQAMQEVAELFIGTHDFTSFCANPIEQTPNQVRTIYRIDFFEEYGEWVCRLEGNGFMRYMVRMLMATLLEVGKNRLSLDEVKCWIEEPNKECCKLNADPCGLYLKEVVY